jgi:thiol:disulfide interchange protein DsbA
MSFARFAAVFALLCCAFAAAPVAAQPAAFVEGKDYFRIDPAQPTATPGKVEVIEVFSHGCGACASLHPQVEAWKKRMSDAAAFRYVPVTFSRDSEALAQGFFAAEALGAGERTHGPMFAAVRAKGRIGGPDDVADLYAGLGLPRADVVAAMESFAVKAKVKRTTQSLPRWGIDATPTFVVAGKYRLTGPAAGSYERLFEILDFLIAREAAAATAGR